MRQSDKAEGRGSIAELKKGLEDEKQQASKRPMMALEQKMEQVFLLPKLQPSAPPQNML